MEPFFVLDNVSYQYPYREGHPIPALEHVSISIEQGEFVALIGQNGSGKSTFARLLNALLVPQSGSVLVTGLDTRAVENRARIHALVGMVFQFPEDQIVSTSVKEDVAFGPENMGLPAEEIRRRVEKALQEVGLYEERSRPPHLLSAGQIQRVALAGVLAMSPRCVVFDEASTMLDPAGRRTLMEAMKRLNRQGTTVIFITHFMDEAVQARRVVAFENGRIVLDGVPKEIFSNQSQLQSIGLDLPQVAQLSTKLSRIVAGISPSILTIEELLPALPIFKHKAGVEYSQRTQAQIDQKGSFLIEVENLGYVYLRGTPMEKRALSDVSLRISKGEGHGLAGMTGSGKSTFLQHLNGLLRPQEGLVRVGNYHINDTKVDRRDIVRQVGLVFQNPETQFFEHYVGDEIAFGPRQLKIAEPGNPLLAERVAWAMERVGLDFNLYKDRPLDTLSGGERRKVALASTLAIQPSILLLDEPTAGLDPQSHQDLLERLLEMQSTGLTILLSSHQMEDMVVLTQRMTVLHKGQITIAGTTGDVFAEPERLEPYGLEPPVAAQIAGELRKKGWPIPKDVLKINELVNEVANAVGKDVAALDEK